MNNKRITELFELIAEYLQKTDRLIDKLDIQAAKIDAIISKMSIHEELFEKQFNRMDLAYQIIIGHSEKIETLQEHSKKILEKSVSLEQEMREKTLLLEREIHESNKKIERDKLEQNIRNEVLLKEIFSISKRVKDLEEN